MHCDTLVSKPILDAAFGRVPDDTRYAKVLLELTSWTSQTTLGQDGRLTTPLGIDAIVDVLMKNLQTEHMAQIARNSKPEVASYGKTHRMPGQKM